MDISLVFENGRYIVKLSGELSYDTRSISKVEENFGVDMAYHFAESVREACLNNGYYNRAKETILQRNVVNNCNGCKDFFV